MLQHHVEGEGQTAMREQQHIYAAQPEHCWVNGARTAAHTPPDVRVHPSQHLTCSHRHHRILPPPAPGNRGSPANHPCRNPHDLQQQQQQQSYAGSAQIHIVQVFRVFE